jgi:hypothetical protein
MIGVGHVLPGALTGSWFGKVATDPRPGSPRECLLGCPATTYCNVKTCPRRAVEMEWFQADLREVQV